MITTGSFRQKVLNTEDDYKMILIRLVVGLIFISEGLQKYMVIPMVGPAFFKELGFDYPMFWAYLTGAVEILCGILVLAGFLTRLASVPLFVIMIIAFITTKIPMLATEDFWTFAHEYNVEFALTLLLVGLFFSGGGKWSADRRIMLLWQ